MLIVEKSVAFQYRKQGLKNIITLIGMLNNIILRLINLSDIILVNN